MSSLSKITQSLPTIFETLINRFGFNIRLEDEYRLLAEGPHSIVDIIFERYEYGMSVSIVDPAHERYRYNFLLLMWMRNPGYKVSKRVYDESFSKEENLKIDLRELCEWLLRFCADILAGDTAAIRAEGYHELASYIDDRMPIVVNMPLDDPISKKFWLGDFTWVSDLRERERAV